MPIRWDNGKLIDSRAAASDTELVGTAWEGCNIISQLTEVVRDIDLDDAESNDLEVANQRRRYVTVDDEIGESSLASSPEF